MEDNIEIEFEVETCSDKYKTHIRKAKYGDVINKTTKESVVFIYGLKKYIVKFTLEYSYDFQNGFNRTRFYDFKYSRSVNAAMINEFHNYINDKFITHDRLSG